MTADHIEARYRRAARERDRCLQELRSHYGQQLPRPVIAAVVRLAESLVHLALTPDDQLEDTIVARR